jgi:hypothetical protein
MQLIHKSLFIQNWKYIPFKQLCFLLSPTGNHRSAFWFYEFILLYVIHVSGLLQYLSVCDWFILLRIMPSILSMLYHVSEFLSFLRLVFVYM